MGKWGRQLLYMCYVLISYKEILHACDIWYVQVYTSYFLTHYTHECTYTYALRRTRDLCYANDYYDGYYYYFVIWIYDVRTNTYVLTSAGSVLVENVNSNIGCFCRYSNNRLGLAENLNDDIWSKPAHFTSLPFIWKFNFASKRIISAASCLFTYN